MYGQHTIVDHNHITCEVWSLAHKHGYQFLCHQTTQLNVKVKYDEFYLTHIWLKHYININFVISYLIDICQNGNFQNLF
jgi:hypothetical protein